MYWKIGNGTNKVEIGDIGYAWKELVIISKVTDHFVGNKT